MKLYNTLNSKVEKFIPNEDGVVKMYTCGPTVYSYAHIGNLRTYIFEDILEKSLNYLGYNVKRCMNITDVGHLTNDSDSGDDKMLLATKREKKSVFEIADYYTEAFKKDCDRLNIKWPEIVSKATDNIDIYIEIIEELLNKGFAYQSGGNVYFDISKTNDYYKLSGKNPDELKVGAREDVEEDKFKKNPGDFGLWFTNSKFENQVLTWDSPWGVGYPGWHIECSGIAIKNLGNKIDIHCGGIDNIFPHHSNEIVQSESYLGHKWCNYWVHAEHLNDDSGKMSKSDGEFLTLDLLISKGYNPLSYRYFCLNSHYRNQLVFSYDSLDQAENAYLKLKSRVLSLGNNGELNNELITKYIDEFKECLSNNLNTSSALTVLYDVLKDDKLTDKSKRYLVESFDTVLSLDLLKETQKEVSEEVLKLIEKREAYKKDKNYAEADKIRDNLKEMGITIKDTKDGVVIS
jgi:cysteinyl-tRNA synthetase